MNSVGGIGRGSGGAAEDGGEDEDGDTRTRYQGARCRKGSSIHACSGVAASATSVPPAMLNASQPKTDDDGRNARSVTTRGTRLHTREVVLLRQRNSPEDTRSTRAQRLQLGRGAHPRERVTSSEAHMTNGEKGASSCVRASSCVVQPSYTQQRVSPYRRRPGRSR